MAHIKFIFSEIPANKYGIINYYEKTRNAISYKYETLQPEFFGMAESEISEIKENLLNELSIESSFSLLTYIESCFRTDFIIRRNWRKRDPLTVIYKKEFKPNQKIYQYPLVDGIFASWKQVYKDIDGINDLFSRLIQAFDFRNWIAHGRYWHFKDNINKYDFNSMLILCQLVEEKLPLQKRAFESTE